MAYNDYHLKGQIGLDRSLDPLGRSLSPDRSLDHCTKSIVAFHGANESETTHGKHNCQKGAVIFVHSRVD